jgi:hypothetical protein
LNEGSFKGSVPFSVIPCYPGTNVAQEGTISIIDTISAGSNYIPGDLLIFSPVSGSGFSGKFNTSSSGSISKINVLNPGSGYVQSSLSSTLVSVVYSGTEMLQDGSVTDVIIDSVGTNFVSGDILISGSQGAGFVASFVASDITGSLKR